MADLRLKIVMDLAERVLGPLRNITKGSTDAAKALKLTRDKLKDLNEQQRSVTELRSTRAGLADTGAQLQAARAKVKDLAAQAAQTGLTAAATAKLAKQQSAAEKAVEALRGKFDAQSRQAQTLRENLARAGLGVGDLHAAQAKLHAQMQTTTADIDRQKAALARHHAVKGQHSKDMSRIAMTAAAGAGAVAAGGAVSNKIQQVMTPYAAQEEAGTGLKVAMMQKGGKVGEDFERINALAIKLGDKLPGTTADFQNMMTMLVRQGMPAKTILGGMGESAAYLGVQLKMPVTAAAEFAAKMQDATQTAEGDMMGLMDVIQKTFYLGVDPDQMLQGMTKAAAIMPLLGKSGLEGSKMLAPMLTMMDQAGMKGEAAGNAVRKVFQLSVDEGKLGKANKVLASLGSKERLEFLDKNGKFAGFDNLVKQLDKVKAITHDGKRTDILKKMFGDDAETHQVLQNLMQKGMAGYHDTVAKMEAQASLNERVNAQLGTLTNIMDAAKGNLTNLLASVGDTYSDDLKEKVKSLGEFTTAAGEWVKENKALVGIALRGAAALAVLLTVLGTVGIALAAIRVPLSLISFGWGLLGLKTAPMVTAAMGTIRVAAMGLLRSFGQLLMKNPFIMLGMAVYGAAQSIIDNWSKITEAFRKDDWSAIGGFLIDGLMAGLNFASFGLLGLVTKIFSGVIDAAKWIFGIQSPSTVFAEIGGYLVDGLINGITSRAAALRDTVVGVASDVANWFKDKLGIQSPSRVFMAAGGFIADGAAIGITDGQDRVRKAVLALTAGAALAMPAMAAQPLQGDMQRLTLDSRPPLSAADVAQAQGAPGRNGADGQGMAAGNTTIQITINPAPGMDPQAIGRAVAAELDKRANSSRARRLSTLGDLS